MTLTPDRPPLGDEVDEVALRTRAPVPSEPPWMRRRDGSVTNW